MEYTIIIDFDGTITTEDVSEYILKLFANGDWKDVEKSAIEGKITMDECIIRQYEMIEGKPEEIRQKITDIPIRSGFFDLIQFVEENEISIKCISAGLSFIIDDYFDMLEVDIPVVAPQAELTDNGVNVELVPYNDEQFVDFKHHHVGQQQQKGKQVIYIGDGTSDFGGIVNADIRYTVKGSSLSEICRDKNLNFKEFETFSEIINDLEILVIRG